MKYKTDTEREMDKQIAINVIKFVISLIGLVYFSLKLANVI